MPHSKISPETFVEIWQTSDTLPQAAKRMNMVEASVRARYNYYVKNGVPLKQLIKSKSNDWAALTNLAIELEKGNDGED